MSALYNSLPARVLKHLADAVYRFRWWIGLPQFLLLGLCLVYTVRKLEFDPNRDNLVGAEKKYHRIFLRYRKEFRGEDDLVVVVESENKEKNRQLVERLGRKLEAQTNLFTDVFYKGDLRMMGPKALLFLPEDTLGELQKTLKEYRPFIEGFVQTTNLNSLFRLVNYQFRTARRETNEANEALIRAMPALTRIVLQATESLKRPGASPSPGLTALFGASDEAEQGQYLTFAEGRFYLVTARAVQDSFNAVAVEHLRKLVRETETEVPGVNVGITGEPVLEYDEMHQSQQDSTVATVVSLILCALIFIYGYREVGRPLKATLCLLVGLGYTMGFTTIAVGHLNILTVTFLPILIGLAIDFGVHLITRYEEELRRGATQHEALQLAMVNTGLGIFTGCFTTAGAFFAMALTDFKGIQEMGVITGGGMLICLIPMMTLLPILLLPGPNQAATHRPAIVAGVERRARIERLWLERPRWVIGLVLALSALSLTQFPKVYFDYNLLNMQSKGLPAVVFEKKLINAASKSVLYAAVVANSVEQAAALEAKLTNMPTVASVESMIPFLRGDQVRKLAAVSAIKQEVSSIQFPPPDLHPVDREELGPTLLFLQGYLDWAARATEDEGETVLTGQLRSLQHAVTDLRQQVALGNRQVIEERLTSFQRALFSDIRETFAALKDQDDRSRLEVKDLPATFRNRFIGHTGKYLLQVFPKQNVWQRQQQEEFVRELRQVAPDVTGTPVQLYEYTNLLKQSYETAAWYALGAIALLVFIHFKRVSSVILALLPVAIGTAWTVGLMGLLDIPFNPANIMTLPLVIGIGVTNGIHILNRFTEEQNPSILAKSTGKAVLVSGLTTIAGFGSLIPAEHQGISSLGTVMATGVAACMLAAVTFLPSLLQVMIGWGWTIRKPSGDNARSTLGREEPR